MKEEISRWNPIDSAPKDQSPVWARGWDWGKPDTNRHYGWAFWNGEEWEWAKSEAGDLAKYLTEWMPRS